MAPPSVTTNLAPKITDSTLALYAAAAAFEEAAVAQATVTSSHAASTNLHPLTACTIRPSTAAAAFMVGTNTGRGDDGGMGDKGGRVEPAVQSHARQRATDQGSARSRR